MSLHLHPRGLRTRTAGDTTIVIKGVRVAVVLAGQSFTREYPVEGGKVNVHVSENVAVSATSTVNANVSIIQSNGNNHSSISQNYTSINQTGCIGANPAVRPPFNVDEFRNNLLGRLNMRHY